jgi:exosortase
VLLSALAATLATFLWAYWPTLARMAAKWNVDPQYSHGYLVPLIALGLLYLRRDELDIAAVRPSWWGAPVLLAGIAMRLVGGYFYLEWFDFLSIVPVAAGICLLIGGWPAFRWAWPGIVFLVFMVPLPFTLENALRDPLRTIGTTASTFLMQTLGLPALAEGHVIIVNADKIGVEEACSGLSMLMVFFALSTAVAIASQRVLWERAVILVSAVPIAIIANVGRITLTGLFYVAGWSAFAKQFHDNAEWFMMPLAIGLLFLEMAVLNRLFITEDVRPMAAGLETGSNLDRPLTI